MGYRWGVGGVWHGMYYFESGCAVVLGTSTHVKQASKAEILFVVRPCLIFNHPGPDVFEVSSISNEEAERML